MRTDNRDENEKGAVSIRSVLRVLVDEAPFIALLCMLAICVGGFVFILRRLDLCLSALELLFLLALAKVIPVKWFSVLRRSNTGLRGGDTRDD